MKAPIGLGDALREWRLSQLTELRSSVSCEEVSLAHGCAFELCELALASINNFSDQQATESWKGVFCSTVSTLAVHRKPDALAMLKHLNERVAPAEITLKFRIYEALMWFDEERANAIELMLTMSLPPDLLKIRDYHLEAFLEKPPSFRVRNRERRRVVDMLLATPIEYSTKKSERSITSWLKTVD